jgi:DNA-binding transcriptional MerR regulator
MNTKGLLPIGQFAQAGGLTVIALRHYDATSVLPPAAVDPSSGYRYYARDQVPTAQLVRMLRQVDVPVDQVPELLTRIEAGEDVLPELAASVDRRTAGAQAALE